jgi:hypothetical protein
MSDSGEVLTFQTPRSERLIQLLGCFFLSLILAVMATVVVGAILFPAGNLAALEIGLLCGLFVTCAVGFMLLLRRAARLKRWASITLADESIRLADSGRNVDLRYAEIEIVQVVFASPHDLHSASFKCPALVLHVTAGKRLVVPLAQPDIERCWQILDVRCPQAGMLWGDEEIAPALHEATAPGLERMSQVRLAAGRLGLIVSGGAVLLGLMKLLHVLLAGQGAFWSAEVLALPAGVVGVIVSWRTLKKGRLLHRAADRVKESSLHSES